MLVGPYMLSRLFCVHHCSCIRATFLFPHLQFFSRLLGCYFSWGNVTFWGLWHASLIVILSRSSVCFLVFLSLPVKTAPHQACLSVWVSGMESGNFILPVSSSCKVDRKWTSGFVLGLLWYQYLPWETWPDHQHAFTISFEDIFPNSGVPPYSLMAELNLVSQKSGRMPAMTCSSLWVNPTLYFGGQAWCYNKHHLKHLKLC